MCSGIPYSRMRLDLKVSVVKVKTNSLLINFAKIKSDAKKTKFSTCNESS
jgi:hypothetical protein